MTPASVDVAGVGKRFGCFAALDAVTMRIKGGEFVAILGPSGCGKTTLLRVIAGLEEPSAGTVRIDDLDVTRLPVSARGCGIVFQSYALFPNLRVVDNVAFGLRQRLRHAAARREKALEMLDLVGLAAHAGKFPAQLSGGQQQRVALARALAVEPRILLLDEPLSALDARVRVFLRDEICKLQRRLGITTIMVTHDQEEALSMADRVVVMDHGVIAQEGTPDEVYHHPASRFVAEFIGNMNFLEGAGLAADGGVSLGGRRMPLRPRVRDGLSTGSLAVRPEDLVLEPAGCDDPAILDGRVERVEFHGASYRILVRLDHGSALQIELSKQAGGRRPPVPGSRVGVRLPAEHLLLLDASSAPTTAGI